MPDTPLDLAVFAELQATAGSDFVAELVQTFFEEAPQMIAELRAAQRAGSAERFRRAAHSLKTNANTFGAAALGAAARELEHGGVPADAHGIDALQSRYDIAVGALRALIEGGARDG
ncbi:MAG TPA: Hpt domain-containing protein [Burkholderiaceae bacterium]|nr:Hpt domain-containing protein [Burkholderiaceae bacterium]